MRNKTWDYLSTEDIRRFVESLDKSDYDALMDNTMDNEHLVELIILFNKQKVEKNIPFNRQVKKVPILPLKREVASIEEAPKSAYFHNNIAI